MKASLDLNVSLIVAFTATGHTVYEIAKYRPKPFILAVTDKDETARYCDFGYGIQSLVIHDMNSLSADSMVEK